MVNQNNIKDNNFRTANNIRKPSIHLIPYKVLSRVVLFLLLVILFGSTSILLEYLGIINLKSNFGRGGRPVLPLGLWHLTDVADNFWASPFIDGLVQHKVVSGYPNDEFRPEQPVTRAEFSAMLDAAFGEKSLPQTERQFQDVPSEFWAESAINNTTASGFWQGYPDRTFRPQETISRANALFVITKGLNLEAESSSEEVLMLYQDGNQVSEDRQKAIAAATEAGLVVSHRDTQLLNPNQNATRAEAAAFIYQALVHLNRAENISAPYIVK